MTFRDGLLARLAVSGTVLLTLSLAPSAAGAAPNLPPTASPRAVEHVPVCVPDHAADTAACHARVRVDKEARDAKPAPASRTAPIATPNVVGNGGAYDPYYLESAYNAPSWATGAGVRQVVAIVDAYDAPRAEADLSAYRSYFGLPACTRGNGCFRKVNQSGVAGNYPAFNSGWAQEISLDLDMVSAMCPQCQILLVEARSANYADLGAAVNTAARLGATAISNSYGGGEWSGETAYESFFNHPGIAVTASSGDNGYGVQFPAASRYVTAVGGTSLAQSTANGYRDGSESAWSGAGSGCSRFIPKPTWQTDGGCTARTVADVSADADPATGVWVYYNNNWYIFGGTSVASPIVAAMYALAGNAASISNAQGTYSHTASLNDVVSGSNGSCGTYLCRGVSGYDGPTGNGTPNGIGAF